MTTEAGYVLGVALAIVVPLVSLLAAGHALLHKRDPRAALGWVAVTLMFPVAGPIGYLLFGINRVRTRARELARRYPFSVAGGGNDAPPAPVALPPALGQLARISAAVTRRPLVAGNRVDPLHNAEQAYPLMLAAIEAADDQVLLASYIFDRDASGHAFIDALARASDRGVDVRVIVDGVGEWYSFKRASRRLEQRGVPVRRFLRPRLLPPSLHLNLRNHRKILVVDGLVAFTGGMNISDRHWVNPPRRRRPVADLHFRLRGPVVAQLAEVFLEDWGFCTGDYDTPPPHPPLEVGRAVCRTIKDGPNEDYEKLSTILLGATGAARRRLAIVTPYFLPTSELLSALSAAALRGVEVTVLLPERSDLRFVDWATRNMLAEPLAHGVGVYCQPPPFAHAKLFLVDDHYVHIGSANIDQRSLRLNFELAVECFDATLSATLWREVRLLRERSRRVTPEELERRSVPERLRDATAWLATPYL